MAIYLKTNDPAGLLATFKKKIDAKTIVTWSYDTDGDFTHTTAQWQNSAWLRPKVQSGQLVFFILCPKGKKLSVEIYAIYHGRFIESMLAHCDKLFSEGIASALPQTGDIVTS